MSNAADYQVAGIYGTNLYSFWEYSSFGQIWKTSDNAYDNHSVLFLIDDANYPGGAVIWDENTDRTYSAFQNMTSLQYVIFNNGFRIGPSGCAPSFYGCTSLYSVKFNNVLNSTEMTSMQYMFSDCTSLSSDNIVWTGLDTSNVTNINYIFYGCSNLMYLDLSNLDFGKVTTCTEPFYRCSKLLYVKTPRKTSDVSVQLPTSPWNQWAKTTDPSTILQYSYWPKNQTSSLMKI